MTKRRKDAHSERVRRLAEKPRRFQRIDKLAPNEHFISVVMPLLFIASFATIKMIDTNGLHWPQNEQPLITVRVMWSTNNVFKTLLSLQNLKKQRWKAHVIFTGFKAEQHRIRTFSSFAHNTLDFANDNRISFELMESNEQVWTEALLGARTPWIFILNDKFEIDETFTELLMKGMDLTGPDGIIFSSSYLGSEPKLITGNFSVGNKDGYAVRVKALATEDGNFSSIQSFCLERNCLMHSTLNKGKEPCSVETVSTKAVENVIQFAEKFREAKEFPFIFSEKDDIYFGKNVLGLEKALRKAWERGCLDSGIQGPIHIIFRSNTPPMSSKYIQFQLEQHSSGFFTSEYILKLKSAMQVWEFSPTNALKLQSKLNISNVFTVPTRTTYDFEDPPIICKGIQFLEGVQSMHSYRDGCYVNWSYASATFTPINISPSPCGKGCNEKNAHDLWTEPEVLLYGYLPCSHDNCRENVCDKLHNAGFRTTCLHQVFGDLLNFFVCRAKIIVVEHFYANASLETHRIDALLLANKSVVAVRSSDPVLDALYSNFITFASKHTLISTVRSLLKRETSHQSEEMQESFKDLATNTDPLCYALNHL